MDCLNLHPHTDNEPVERHDALDLFEDVYVYRSGPPWVIEDITFGIIKSHYWVEAFGQRWGLGGKERVAQGMTAGWSKPLGPQTLYTGEHDWRVKWGTVRRTKGHMKIRDRATGEVKMMRSCDATADDILNAMELIRDTIRPFKILALPPRTCWTITHRLIAHCGLKRGPILATRPGRPIFGSRR